MRLSFFVLPLVFVLSGSCIAEIPSLKVAARGHFLIGVAVNESQFGERNVTDVELVKSQFTSISPENALKWSSIHPQPNRFHFEPADEYVAFGEKNGMFVIGHNLVWHSQVPDWVFQDEKGNPVDRQTLLDRMRDHIFTVVGRYKGRIKGWDVVNEGLAEDGSLRNSPWRRIIGDDYIEKAFEFAHQADPAAELYYNDYGIESGSKSKGALALIAKLKSENIPITGVGIQEHVNLSWPTAHDLDATISAFGKLGVKVMITELDVDVLPSRRGRQAVSADVNGQQTGTPSLDPYVSGLPDAKQRELASRYAELFGIYLKHQEVVSRVTLWGVTDADSWLNGFPIHGRTNYPLLFDRAGQAKPALDSVVDLLKSTPQLPNAHP